MRGRLDAAAHDEASDGEVVKLGHDGQGPALGDLKTKTMSTWNSRADGLSPVLNAIKLFFFVGNLDVKIYPKNFKAHEIGGKLSMYEKCVLMQRNT